MNQSKWIVESPTHLRMLPEMEKPEYPEIIEENNDRALMYNQDLLVMYDNDLKAYNKALASQPTIKRGDNGQWKEGDVKEENVDFEIIENVVAKKTCPHCGGHDIVLFSADDDLCNGCKKWFPAVSTKAVVEKVAIPKQQESEESEDEIWDEVGEILKKTWTMAKVKQQLKQHYSIKRK